MAVVGLVGTRVLVASLGKVVNKVVLVAARAASVVGSLGKAALVAVSLGKVDLVAAKVALVVVNLARVALVVANLVKVALVADRVDLVAKKASEEMAELEFNLLTYLSNDYAPSIQGDRWGLCFGIRQA